MASFSQRTKFETKNNWLKWYGSIYEILISRFFKLIKLLTFNFDGSNSIRSRKILTFLCKHLNSLMTPETDMGFPRVPADCQLFETV